MSHLSPRRLIAILALAVFAAASAATYAADSKPAPSCPQDGKRQAAASREVQKIAADDQSDRPNNEMKPGARDRDRERRKRIGELFGEGCLRSAADFAAAALVFQHGEVPEHFLQAYVWAKRAVELGDEEQKQLMALGIDRYLVSTGRKQLFGTQASKLDGDRCWCLEAVESAFPKELRRAYIDATLEEKFAWVDSMNKDPRCPKNNFCSELPTLKDTPAGTIPGLW